MNLPPIREALRGRSLLITGATGFLAKIFVAKLFRVAPELKTLYVLVRAPDDLRAAERLETEIFSSPLFDEFRADDPAEFARRIERVVRFIPGNTSEPRLGLSPAHQLELSDEVDFVVNSAASTNFRESLESALKTNTISVAWILDFIQNSTKAKLLHISTCYVGERQNNIIYEEVSEQSPSARLRFPRVDATTLNLEEIIRGLESRHKQKPSVDQDCDFAQSLGWNNVYTLSKWLGERLLVQSKIRIPVTILRPSIIESCAQDPIPGWIEGFKVADPLFYLGGRDEVRYFPGDNKTVVDIIPADRVANAMFLCLAELSAKADATLKIYQVSSSAQAPVTLGEITRIVRGVFGLGHLKRSFFVSRAWFFHIASLALFAVRIAAKVLPARFSKTHEECEKLMEWAKLYAPYTSVTNLYSNQKLLALADRASRGDHLQFPVSMKSFDWHSYLAEAHMPGLMKFVLKKPIDSRGRSPKVQVETKVKEQASA